MDTIQITKLMANIVRLFEKHSETQLDPSSLEAKQVAHKYSNTKHPIYRLFLNGKLVNNKNNLAIEYQCIRCNALNVVALNNIKRKINNGMKGCIHCNETPERIAKHEQFFQDLQDGMTKMEEKHTLTIAEKVDKSKTLFEEEDDDFKDNYFRKHLRTDEFQRIRPQIISIQNGNIGYKALQSLVYHPAITVSNQTRYAPYLFDPHKQYLIKINYITFMCEVCGDHFTNRDLCMQKNKYKLLCQDCNFSNNTFKIKQLKNHLNETLTYQSKLELKFINFCKGNKLRIIDGPRIFYKWKPHEKVYRVDFLLPSLGLLIELKDNHCWHREQVESGKWGAKEKAAKEYCASNGLEFMMIYPKNYVDQCSKIKNLLINKI